MRSARAVAFPPLLFHEHERAVQIRKRGKFVEPVPFTAKERVLLLARLQLEDAFVEHVLRHVVETDRPCRRGGRRASRRLTIRRAVPGRVRLVAERVHAATAPADCAGTRVGIGVGRGRREEIRGP